jgi:hypothetical protein
LVVAPFALSLVRGSRKKRPADGLSDNRGDLIGSSTCWLLQWDDVLGKTPNGSAEIEPSTLDLPLLGEEFFSSECVLPDFSELARRAETISDSAVAKKGAHLARVRLLEGTQGANPDCSDDRN